MKHEGKARITAPSSFVVRPSVWALAALAGLTLAMFADVLFTTQRIVLSNADTDLFHQFIHWRKFGFEQLRQGNLALWNPHLFSGAPFFGGFQAALLYPPNFLHLVLPLDRAINVGIALHVFLAGAFTYLWAANRGLQPLAAFFSAILFMFCGAHFLHIYAGHLPNLCAMVWAPLLFLAIDRLFARPSVGPCLLGMFAVAMQILAGHPQYVFYTAVAAAVYSALCFARATSRWRIAAGLVAICLGGAALSAVQLLTGLEEAREMVRGRGLVYEFAAMFSLPPENFLTLLAPTFFGDGKTLPYWGRCYLWEMSLFLSVTGLVLAVYGAVAGGRSARRFSVVMVVILLVLALGDHTPLFPWLYQHVPGFNKFRGTSKFIFLASLFLALLAGVGLNRILKTRRWPVTLAVLPFLAGVGLVILSVYVRGVASQGMPGGAWDRILTAVYETEESYLPRETHSNADFQWRAGRHAANSLLRAGGTLLLLSLLGLATRRWPRFAPGLVLLALAELFVFGRKSLDHFELAKAESPELKALLAAQPGDYRILNLAEPNRALSLPAYELWGYDPGVPLRYAEFIAFTQGLNPDEVTQNVLFHNLPRLYAMLRCRYAFVPGQDGKIQRLESGDWLPRLQLVQRYRVLAGRDEMFAAMNEAAFNPREEVLLESAPEPAPVSSNQSGTVGLVDSSTDHLTIAADVPSPAILLITDSYAKGWRARALPGSAQDAYQILPANHCLRAIPLAAGRHRLRVEYSPKGFVCGRWLSAVSAVLFAVFTFRCGRGVYHARQRA